MPRHIHRRRFLKHALMGSAALASSLSLEERTLLARGTDRAPSPGPDRSPGGFPRGAIGKVTISRLICGGNLTNGYAHSRDLIYVSDLLQNYFTDEKIFKTWELCEENGINTVIANVRGGKGDQRTENTVGVLKKYWQERGGSVQWIAQTNPQEDDVTGSIQRAVDNGAVGAFIQGGVADRFVKTGRLDLVEKAVRFMKQNGLIAGVGGHAVDVPMACEKEGIDPDFYFKTLNAVGYCSETPQKTIEFMREVKKPWIAYKVLGAGVVHPREGFRVAFEGGADFICAGMFDFQVIEDVLIAKKTLPRQSSRPRPWRG